MSFFKSFHRNSSEKDSKPSKTSFFGTRAQPRTGEPYKKGEPFKNGFFNDSEPFFKPQPKLKVGESNDKFEQEADHVANQVVNHTKGDAVQKKSGEEEIQQKPLVQNSTSDNGKSSDSSKSLIQKTPEEEPAQNAEVKEKPDLIISRESFEGDNKHREEILKNMAGVTDGMIVQFTYEKEIEATYTYNAKNKLWSGTYTYWTSEGKKTPIIERNEEGKWESTAEVEYGKIRGSGSVKVHASYDYSTNTLPELASVESPAPDTNIIEIDPNTDIDQAGLEDVKAPTDNVSDAKPKSPPKKPKSNPTPTVEPTSREPRSVNINTALNATFQAGTSTLNNPTQVQNQLQALVDILINNPNTYIILRASTNVGGDPNGWNAMTRFGIRANQLATNRNFRIRSMLMSMGVPANQIRPSQLGDPNAGMMIRARVMGTMNP